MKRAARLEPRHPRRRRARARGCGGGAAEGHHVARAERSRRARPARTASSTRELATAASRTIVRPSPDLAYSSAVFDVSERPLHVVVPLSAPYTSLSGFASNTDNFFAVNDRSAGGDVIDVVLVGPSTPRDGLEGLRVIESPSDRGVLLVRRVVPSAEAFPVIDAARQRARAELR